jgi:hypothetical protein
MKRRQFIAGLASAAAWRAVAQAQQVEHIGRIGVLMPYDENDDLGYRRRRAAELARAATTREPDRRAVRRHPTSLMVSSHTFWASVSVMWLDDTMTA